MNVIILLITLFSINLFGNTVVTQKAVINQNFYPNKTFLEIKELLLKKAKHKAIAKIYGEYIISNSNFSDGKVTSDSVNDVSSGVIHLQGEPIYSNGTNFGEVQITIIAYATSDEIQNSINIRNSTGVDKTPIESKKSKTTRQGFYGKWSGYIMSNLSGTTKVIITISSTGQSKMLFPTLRCESDLVIKSKDISYVSFKQILNYGSPRCVNGTKVLLEKIDDNKINVEQISQDGEEISHGTLYYEE